MDQGDVLELKMMFSVLKLELSAMMYCNHGPKRDFLNGNCRT